MACTTILVGKKASYDGSTMIARNDDSGSGHFTAKKFTVVHPEDLPKVYRSVLSHVEVPLPEGAMRFTATLGIFVRAMGTSSVPSELFSALPYILVIILTVCRKQFNVPAKLGANYVKED